MNAILILAISLCGQTDVEIRAQQNREWFLARFMVDMQMAGNYTPEVFAKVEEQVNNLSPERVNMMVEYYKQQKATADQHNAQVKKAYDEWVLGQAQLNLARAQAYRDHLSRELQIKIAQENLKAEQLRWSSQMANQMFWRSMNNWGWNGYGGHRPYYHRPHYHYRY